MVCLYLVSKINDDDDDDDDDDVGGLELQLYCTLLVSHVHCSNHYHTYSVRSWRRDPVEECYTRCSRTLSRGF